MAPTLCDIDPLGFRPLRKIPHCCLLYTFGPCFNPSVVDHPLIPAIDCCLGKPLPHQLVNQTQAPPWANFSFCSLTYGVWPTISSCPFPKGRCLCVIQISTIENTTRMLPIQLACVKHVASIHPMPGSNSPWNSKLHCL